MFVQILRRVGKRRENQNFFVVRVYRVFNLVPDDFQQRLQFVIVSRADVARFRQQMTQNDRVRFQIPFPRQIIHIRQGDADFVADKQICVIVVRQFGAVAFIDGLVNYGAACLFQRVFVNDINDLFDFSQNARNRLIERINGTFHALHQIRADQAAHAAFAVFLAKENALADVAPVQAFVFVDFAGENVFRRRIDAQRQFQQIVENLRIRNGVFLQT